MIDEPPYPDLKTAKYVASRLLKVDVLDAHRLTTGNKNFVFAINTKDQDFVIRMTTGAHKDVYHAAAYWQEKLLPLGIPLAKFIGKDLNESLSPFPALLMEKIPGDDICNLYGNLTLETKRNLAQQIVDIHA